MDSSARLQLIARITYYLGWLAAIVGGFLQFGLGVGIFQAIDLRKRNLFEAAVMLFVVSIASVARSLAAEKK
ncbi:MAG TPA: hypothetical protein VEK33_21730 [Terriglobales bacterium]|nr:hypothetical protein [Terriglobales bacterium]